MPVPTHGITDPKVLPFFDKDLKDLHLIYDYDAKDAEGNPEKWKYEMYFPRCPDSPTLIPTSIEILTSGHVQVVLLLKPNRLRNPRRSHGW